MRIATGALRPRNDGSRKNLRVIPRPVRRLVVGSEPSAASGRGSEVSEWPRSKFPASAVRQRRNFGHHNRVIRNTPAQRSRRTDCHTSDIGHWFAMTHYKKCGVSPDGRTEASAPTECNKRCNGRATARVAPTEGLQGVRCGEESPSHGFAVPAPFRQGAEGTGGRIATASVRTGFAMTPLTRGAV